MKIFSNFPRPFLFDRSRVVAQVQMAQRSVSVPSPFVYRTKCRRYEENGNPRGAINDDQTRAAMTCPPSQLMPITDPNSSNAFVSTTDCDGNRVPMDTDGLAIC